MVERPVTKNTFTPLNSTVEQQKQTKNKSTLKFKKMKKLIIAALIAVSFTTSAFAADVNKVNSLVLNAFNEVV